MARLVLAGHSALPPALCGCLVACVFGLLVQPAQAQAPQPQIGPSAAPPVSQSQPEPPAPEAAEQKPEGFFSAWERWNRDLKAKIDEANAKWRASVEETNAKLKASADETNAKLKASVEDNNARWRESAKEAAAAQKEAADAFKNLANTRMVEGRQVCEPAPNGSPDCHAAAEVICKGKGFAIGKSADITTTRKCSARALLRRDESECRTETVVIKAACQ
jgi:hypothetical protein